MPTFQRGELAARSIAALADIAAPEGGVEIVVVDDGSDAAHVRSVEKVVASITGARLVRQPNRGPGAARNRGVAETSAPLVVFIDDDCTPATHDWLLRLVAPFGEDGAPGGVGGRVVPAPPTNWVSRFLAVTEYSSGLQPIFENAATANACYRRDVLDELNGFDERFRHPGGDDPDLSARARAAGHRLVFAADAVVEHSELESYGDFMGHMYRRGVGEARLAAKQGRKTHVAMRATLFPLFLGRTGVGTWRRTAGKGSAPIRSVWVALETLGRAAFVVGSVRGLLSEAQ
jgi:GT2 family glycosyltransferase